MRLFNAGRARAGFQSVSARPGYGFINGGGSVDGRNWRAEAGLGYDIAPVFAAVMYAVTALTEVDIITERQGSDGNYHEVPNHPITRLLADPNPWYDRDAYLSGCLISEMCSHRGMSQSIKHRSTANKVIGLEYMPHYHVQPETFPGSGNFIDRFRVTLSNGGIKYYDPSDVLENRFSFMNPLRPQESYGPMNALITNVATTKHALAFTAAMLSNVAAGVLLSPAKLADGTTVKFEKEQRQQVREALKENMGGGNAGGMFMVPLGVNVDRLSFSPNELQWDAVLNIAEEHICAAFHIPPATLYLGTGLEHQNNRASADAAAIAGARGFVKPYMMRKGREWTRDLVPELGQPGDRVRFRIEDVEALQEDKNSAAERDELEVTTYKTINEKRAEKGLPPLADGNRILEKQAKPTNDSTGASPTRQ